MTEESRKPAEEEVIAYLMEDAGEVAMGDGLSPERREVVRLFVRDDPEGRELLRDLLKLREDLVGAAETVPAFTLDESRREEILHRARKGGLSEGSSRWRWWNPGRLSMAACFLLLLFGIGILMVNTERGREDSISGFGFVDDERVELIPGGRAPAGLSPLDALIDHWQVIQADPPVEEMWGLVRREIDNRVVEYETLWIESAELLEEADAISSGEGGLELYDSLAGLMNSTAFGGVAWINHRLRDAFPEWADRVGLARIAGGEDWPEDVRRLEEMRDAVQSKLHSTED